MMEKPTVILLRETAMQSLISDAGTFATLLGLIGIGILAGSTALEWSGAAIAFILVLQKAVGKTTRMTISEARAKLDEIERGRT